MPRLAKISGIYRVLDANINRAKEGLRVCEEVTRFILNDQGLTRRFKKLRHRIDVIVKGLPYPSALLRERESQSDVGKRLDFSSNSKRDSYRDIFSANLQRAKEAVRVLEEFAKLDDVAAAMKFMDLRYEIYALEKKAIPRLIRPYRQR